MIRVMIADDCLRSRILMRRVLEQDSDIKVVGLAGNGEEAADRCTKIKPDLVLMDLHMPVCDGIEGTRLIKKRNNNIKILIFTKIEEEEYINKALYYGADGYVFKDINDEVLIGTIKSMVNGLSVFDYKVVDIIRDNLIKSSLIKTDIKKRMNYNLTSVDIQIIRLIVEGKNNKEIGKIMSFTEGTVKNKVTVILKKLNAKDRIQLAVFAFRYNLI